MRPFAFIIFVLIPSFAWSQQVIEKEITDWEFRMIGDSVWKKAKVPGTIIDNFVDLSDISNPLHPYYGDNEKLYQWIGEKDWEFRTTVVPDSNLLANGYSYNIEFGSLDLFANIFMKGLLWTSSNAFTPTYAYGFTEKELKILIQFRSTVDSLQSLQSLDSLKLPGNERVYGRTAQYQFGWDWGPKFVNMGIRKPVKLIYVKSSPVTIYDLRFDPWEKGKKNILSIFVNGESTPKKLDWYFTIYLNGDSVDGFVAKDWHGYLDGAYVYYMENPELWFPNGMGKKTNYYEFDLRLTLPGDTHTLAHKREYYAYCDIDLIQKKDKKGESFYFTVNNEKVFAKGANYIPDDSFHPGKNTTELVNLAATANMNMLRVWGGGTYPDDHFYIQCMKRGIMVWQDYMFACAMYPVNESFIYSAEDEVSFQTEKLQYYNNIAVLCGNNENDEGWKNWGWQKEFKYSPKDSTLIWNGYLKLFDQSIKETIAWYDTTLQYISSSPKHGWGRKESMTEGDSHYWGVWWGLEPIEKYNEKVPRFMSEFGMQSMPDLSTLKKVIPDSAMNFASPKFKNHQKHPTGFETLNHYLKKYLVVPDNMEDYAYATQILQAYALTTAIEAQRRAMPYCMGSLIWQLNDCWPVTSWSLVDYELKEKIAYHEVRSAFEGLSISIKEESDRYDIYIINDSLKDFNNQTMSVEISNFYGELIIPKTKTINIKKQSSKIYYSLHKKSLVGIDLTSVYMQVWLIRLSTYKTFHFVPLNKLKLPKAEFKFEKTEYKDFYRVTSNVYAPYVEIDGDWYQSCLIPDVGGLISVRNKRAGYIKYLESNPDKIKCLNNLLNPHK